MKFSVLCVDSQTAADRFWEEPAQGSAPEISRGLRAHYAKLVNNSEVPAIFEATFRHDGVLVQVDVLRRSHKKEFELIEVKSSTTVKPYHLLDVSIQQHVLRGAGIRVKSNHVMHVNRD